MAGRSSSCQITGSVEATLKLLLKPIADPAPSGGGGEPAQVSVTGQTKPRAAARDLLTAGRAKHMPMTALTHRTAPPDSRNRHFWRTNRDLWGICRETGGTRNRSRCLVNRSRRASPTPGILTPPRRRLRAPLSFGAVRDGFAIMVPPLIALARTRILFRRFPGTSAPPAHRSGGRGNPRHIPRK